jgi:pantoate--beta-alanine ligase
MRLTKEAREKAAIIFQCLQTIKASLQPGALAPLQENAWQKLEAAGFTPDYVALADAADLSPVTGWDGRQQLVALVAAYLDGIRLIDNLVLN